MQWEQIELMVSRAERLAAGAWRHAFSWSSFCYSTAQTNKQTKEGRKKYREWVPVPWQGEHRVSSSVLRTRPASRSERIPRPPQRAHGTNALKRSSRMQPWTLSSNVSATRTWTSLPRPDSCRRPTRPLWKKLNVMGSSSSGADSLLLLLLLLPTLEAGAAVEMPSCC